MTLQGKITVTLSEILNNTSTDEFEKFCEEFGYNVYVVNEGGGHIEVTMSLEKAVKYGIVAYV